MISLPYIILELSYLLLAALESSKITFKDKYLRIRVLCCFSFIIFFGFRGFIGWDFSSYYPKFQECGFHQLLEKNFIFEPGFNTYMVLLKSIWNNYHFFIFVSTLIDITILNFVIKRYGINYALCMALYITFMGIFEIDLQRNVKSTLLFLLSIQYILQRKWKPFFLINLLGLSFHSSAILYFPCYFFLSKVIPKKNVIILFIILEILYLLGVSIFLTIMSSLGNAIGGIYGTLINGYLENDNFAISRGFSIGHLERSITFLLIIFNYNDLIHQKKFNRIFINSFLVFFSIQVLFNGLSVVANRLANLFVFSYFVVWPSLLYCYRIHHNKLKMQLWCIFICIYSILKIDGYYSGLFFEYDNILFGIKPYNTRYQIFKNNSENILKNNLNQGNN